MTHRPSIRQLQYLIALYETGSFRKAAEACCVGQSAISIALRELEELLSTTLFERTNRRVQPSVECEQIIDDVRHIVAGLDALVSRTKGAGSIFTQVQRLGVIHTIAPYLLPRLLPEIRSRWPRMQLYLREGKTDQLLEELDQNKLDLVVMAFPFLLGNQFEKTFIAEDPFWMAMPEGHPLAGRWQIGAEDITPSSLLLLEDGHCLRDHARDACLLDNSQSNQAFSGTSLDTLLHMVMLGMGVTLLPAMAVHSPLMTNLRVVFRPLKSSLPVRQPGLVWRSTSAHADDYRALGQCMRDVLVRQGR